MDPDALKLLQTEFIEDCLNFSSATLMVYEYLTTIDHEVELVWRRNTKLSLPSILLVSTRVCMVATAIISVTPSSTTCTGFTALDILMQIAELTSFIQVALFSALRVSALYGSNIALFVSVFALGLVPVGTNIYNQTRTTYVPEMGTCIAITTVSEGLIRKFVLATRIPVIMADFLVLTLTWAKTYRQILLSRSAGISAPLSACLARDGALYFLVLLTLNILQIASNRTQIGAPVSIIVSALPSVLINRFMINLRHVGSGPDSSGSVTPDRLVISTPRFQLSDQVVGSMGEPLEHGAPVVYDEEEDEAYEGKFEVDGYNPELKEREGAQERSALEVSGSGVVLV